MPPENNINGRVSQGFYDFLTNIIFKLDDFDMCLFMGDMNARCGQESDIVAVIDGSDIRSRNIIDDTKNSRGPIFMDFLKSVNYLLINGRITPELDNFTCISHKGRSVVDYMFTPRENIKNTEQCAVLTVTELCSELDIHSDRGKPDHSILCADLSVSFVNHVNILSDSKNAQPNVNSQVLNERMYLKHNCKVLPETFMSSEYIIRQINITIDSIEQRHTNQENIDSIYERVCEIYYNEMDEKLKYFDCRNTKRARRTLKPWWNQTLAQLFDVYRQAEKRYLKCTYRAEKARLLAEFKLKRGKFDKQYRKAKRSYDLDIKIGIAESETQNPKDFWNKLKSLGHATSKTDLPNEVRLENGDIVTDQRTVLNKWKNDFSTLYNTVPTEEPVNVDTFRTNESDGFQGSEDLNVPITFSECKRVISLAKSGKAIGIGCLPNEVFKNDSSVLLLHAFFQDCFSCHCLPSPWAKSITKPIPKNAQNDPRIPSNYRGISLIPTMCKLYTNILNKRLVEYMDINNVIQDEQNGFRKDRSCEDHIYSLTSIIRNRKNDGRDKYTCFVDMAKAFDRVNRDILFIKLANIGVSGNMLESIKTLYAECKASVNVNGSYTDFFNITAGVKQGDGISPTLFSIFIDNLVKGIKELDLGVEIDTNFQVSTLLFADDIVLIAPNEVNLQLMLDYLTKWCVENRMEVNINKTKIIHFRKTNSARTVFNFHLGNCPIDICDTYKYLGIILNEHLDYTETANALSESAGRAFSSLIVNLYNKMDLLYSSYTKVYETKLVPIMDYSSSVWGAKCYPKTDTLHNRIIRFYLGVHKCTSNAVIQGDMGWAPPIVRRQVNCLRLWNRLVKLDNSRLTRRIFEWDYLKGRHNWCFEVKNILKTIDFGDKYTRALTDGQSALIPIEDAKNKLMLKYKQKWRNDIESQNKLENYKIIKHDYGAEEYVTLMMGKKLRSALVQLRAGCLPIEIELGRYLHIPRNERLCKQCSMGTVESEKHFLFHCTKYHVLRQDFTRAISGVCPPNLNDDHKLLNIFSSKALTLKTAHFICDALQLRIS